MKKWVLGSLIGGTTASVVGVSLGVPLGIIAAQALQAKHALEKVASKGGPRVNLEKRLKDENGLNIVALGDSITAGYNGFLGTHNAVERAKNPGTPVFTSTGESYADFLVQSIKNAEPGKNIVYHNYAQNGLRLADMDGIIEGGAVSRELKQADLIPVTIGSNDILRFMNFFGIPFNAFENIIGSGMTAPGPGIGSNLDNAAYSLNFVDNNGKLSGTGLLDFNDKKEISGTPTSINAQKAWDAFLPAFEAGSRTGGSQAVSVPKVDSQDMLMNTIRDLGDISTGKVGQYINLDKDYQDKIFDLVKSGIMKMVKELHDLAPHAQIMLLGPAMPFAQFPNDVLTSPNQYNENKTLGEEFKRLLGAMSDGAKFGIDRPSNFVDFFSADQLPSMKPYSYLDFDNNMQPTKAPKVLYTTEGDFDNSIKNKPVTNITDIHPSIFGHQLIGKDLFNFYGKQLGLSAADITKDTQQSYAWDTDTKKYPERAAWLRQDENPTVVNDSYTAAKSMNSLLTLLKTVPNGLLTNLFNQLSQLKVPSLSKDPAALQLTTIKEVQDQSQAMIKKIVSNIKIKGQKIPDAMVTLAVGLLTPNIFPLKIAELRVANSKNISEEQTLKSSLMGVANLFELIKTFETILPIINPPK